MRDTTNTITKLFKKGTKDMTKDQIEKIEARIEEQLERLNYEDAKTLSEILKNVKEADAAASTKQTEMVKILSQLVTGLIQIGVGSAIYLHGVHLGFRFEQTGSITSKTMNRIFLSPPKL